MSHLGMTYVRIFILSLLNVVAIYLFVAAPPPLPDAAQTATQGDKRVPVLTAFEACNTINSEARRIYTARIVGIGKEAGLAFDENWRDADKEAGPLPALFFRLVASDLTRNPEPLSVFLGSDAPINPSNKFTGEQTERFALIKRDGFVQFFVDSDRNQVAMFPDPASAKPCVSCHNEHQGSPKKDWRLDEAMGAATWIYPKPDLDPGEYAALVRNVYAGVEAAWNAYLAKTATFRDPPAIGSEWPGKGTRVLPDAQTFMAEVYRASAPKVLSLLNDRLAPPARQPDASKQAKLETQVTR